MKIRSIPTNKPITHRPEIGHCCQIKMPKTKLMIPPTSTQPQCGNRYITEPMISEESPDYQNAGQQERHREQGIAWITQEKKPQDGIKNAHQETQQETAPVTCPKRTRELCNATYQKQYAKGHGGGKRRDERHRHCNGTDDYENNPQREKPNPIRLNGF